MNIKFLESRSGLYGKRENLYTQAQKELIEFLNRFALFFQRFGTIFCSAHSIPKARKESGIKVTALNGDEECVHVHVTVNDGKRRRTFLFKIKVAGCDLGELYNQITGTVISQQHGSLLDRVVSNNGHKNPEVPNDGIQKDLLEKFESLNEKVPVRKVKLAGFISGKGDKNSPKVINAYTLMSILSEYEESEGNLRKKDVNKIILSEVENILEQPIIDKPAQKRVFSILVTTGLLEESPDKREWKISDKARHLVQEGEFPNSQDLQTEHQKSVPGNRYKVIRLRDGALSEGGVIKSLLNALISAGALEKGVQMSQVPAFKQVIFDCRIDEDLRVKDPKFPTGVVSAILHKKNLIQRSSDGWKVNLSEAKKFGCSIPHFVSSDSSGSSNPQRKLDSPADVLSKLFSGHGDITGLTRRIQEVQKEIELNDNEITKVRRNLDDLLRRNEEKRLELKELQTSEEEIRQAVNFSDQDIQRAEALLAFLKKRNC